MVAEMQEWEGGEVPGRQLRTIIDTLHFVSSHDSAGVQMADLVAYIIQRRRSAEGHPDVQAALNRFIILVNDHTHTWRSHGHDRGRPAIQSPNHLRVFRAGTFITASTTAMTASSSSVAGSGTSRTHGFERPLSEFERNGTATLVRHPSRTIVGLLPRAVPPDEIIQRAEFLVKCTPPNRYNLLGFNCEMAANWCVCGGYSESHQTRTVFLLSAVWGGYQVIRWARRGSRRDGSGFARLLPKQP